MTFAASDKHNVSSLQFAPVINCRTESDGCAAWSRPSIEKNILSTCFSSSRCDIFNVFITLCAKEKLCHGPGFCFVGLEFRLQVFEEFISVWRASVSSLCFGSCGSSSSFSVSLLVFPSLSSLCLCPHVCCVSSCFHVYCVFLWIVSSTRDRWECSCLYHFPLVTSFTFYFCFLSRPVLVLLPVSLWMSWLSCYPRVGPSLISPPCLWIVLSSPWASIMLCCRHRQLETRQSRSHSCCTSLIFTCWTHAGGAL